MKKTLSLICISLFVMVLAACGSNETSSGNTQSASKKKDTITMVWFPNESGAELKEAREEFSKIIGEATGKKVEHQTTTDYIIAIEALANGNADIGYMGAQAYVEANAKNSSVLPLFVHSGESGTLDDAVYYSWLAVKKSEEESYMSDGKFSMGKIAGKKFSFVSNSSTSGFKVPSAGIVSHFGQTDKFKDLTTEDLLQGGDDKVFSEVLFGGSHQGSAVNLLTGKSDVSAFCSTCVANYVELVSGEHNKPGAVYKVKEGAEEPFNALAGEGFVLISATPVLNQPFAVNTASLSEEDRQKMLELFTSDAVTNNEKIFLPKDAEGTAILKKKSGKEKFLPVDDAFFNPVRELSVN
ncbi:phosphate/phosphite/phosphonate ABC transporter substrate-binding protein [Paenibacillus luteus]|uniref:phosphate/phosphite/phosphonate ABC transporter substrate-binding protein n=1 Tax=Paenibacillus luteus TaxID=2545753 RepID=UPI0011430341|nr:phosphate/phosphite/phosphonate ABC transporter substrate-binding protein [Paenibacillus luteus]